jgi:hypothetical protein
MLVKIKSRKAAAFCAVGACRRVANANDAQIAVFNLDASLGGKDSVTSWSDRQRDKNAVIRRMRKVAAKLKEQGW